MKVFIITALVLTAVVTVIIIACCKAAGRSDRHD